MKPSHSYIRKHLKSEHVKHRHGSKTSCNLATTRKQARSFFLLAVVLLIVKLQDYTRLSLPVKLDHKENKNIEMNEQVVALTGEGDCSNILLHLQDSNAHGGIGSQLNNYVLATIISFLTNRSLVGFSDFHANAFGSSQFGCPSGNFTVDDASLPHGLGRLLKTPQWLSGSCGNPCLETYTYDYLLKISKNETLYNITCADKNGRNVSVLPLDTFGLRLHARPSIDFQRLRENISYSELYSRTGATSTEIAWLLSKGKVRRNNRELWDQLVSILNRRGIIAFQPWINRDVASRLKDVNLTEPYIAVHIRRGDKLLRESKPFVRQHWQKRGYNESTQPKNYVPFAHYMEHLKEDKNIKTVYIATDDPVTVKQEIANFTNTQGYTFILNPDEASSTGHSVHNIHDCRVLYSKTIAAVTDLSILLKADIFVGEFSSNWGRFLYMWRTSFVNNTVGTGHPGDMHSVFGAWTPPGW